MLHKYIAKFLPVDSWFCFSFSVRIVSYFSGCFVQKEKQDNFTCTVRDLVCRSDRCFIHRRTRSHIASTMENCSTSVEVAAGSWQDRELANLKGKFTQESSPSRHQAMLSGSHEIPELIRKKHIHTLTKAEIFTAAAPLKGLAGSPSGCVSLATCPGCKCQIKLGSRGFQRLWSHWMICMEPLHVYVTF